MSKFNSNIDEANLRVTTLEAQLGLAQSEFIENLDACNARIQELEAKQAQPKPAPVVVQQPAKLEPKPLPNDLAAMQKSGKVFGLGKAMIAATQQHQAK